MVGLVVAVKEKVLDERGRESKRWGGRENEINYDVKKKKDYRLIVGVEK